MLKVVAAAGVTVTAVILYLKRKKKGPLSSRGLELTAPVLPYMSGVIKAFSSPFDAETNPDGYILLAVAENKLMWPEMKERVSVALSPGMPDWVANYGPAEGDKALREVLVFLMGRTMYYEVPDPCPFQFGPDDLICTSGVGAALSNLFYCIAEPGDVVLIPSPYYSAFDFDLRVIARLNREAVPLDEANGYVLTPAALARAYGRSLLKYGRKPRAVLLTNPHNPLGRIMTAAELRAVVAWCDKHDIHLVSDEIYALSTFAESASTGAAKFVSLATVCSGQLDHNKHILWGLSKDFGLSGFRLGVVWSGSDKVKHALRAASVFTWASCLTQAVMADVLGDHGWVNGYLRENRRRLARSCDHVQSVLKTLEIPYVQPVAGMFLLADFSAVLPLLDGVASKSKPSWTLEQRFYEWLLDDFKVILTPGQSQHATTPGWFRICFAFVPFDTLALAMDRISAAITKLRHNIDLEKE